MSDSIPRTRKELIDFLLKTPGLTTPILQNYLGCCLRLKHHICSNIRHYQLCLPSGRCVEAGYVRAISNQGLDFFQVDVPLGLWAQENRWVCEKKNITTVFIREPRHPVIVSLDASPEDVIGRSYTLILRSNDQQVLLEVEEFWNTSLF